MNRTELLDFHGVSRSVLEARIVELVAFVDVLKQRPRDLEERLRGRLSMNERTQYEHAPSDPVIAARIAAYQTALSDLRELLLPSTD